MKRLYFLLLLAALVCGAEHASAQFTIDPSWYITVDNAANLVSGTTANTPDYVEVGPWYSGTTGLAFGPGYRQTSALG
ncbi:MAG: hypothetical protein NTV54_15760, partial [Ignavibacteriales bacterium]|nr:hypothetical protein [Ignavibacteriales bacterium]